MKIGIDIDGVLTDIEQWQIDFGSKFCHENYNIGINNPKGYKIDEIFGISRQYDDLFWEKYDKEYFANIELRRFANEVIKLLKEDGYVIYIITARGNPLSDSIKFMSKEEIEKITINWLKQNDICYDKIIFSEEDKLDICLNNNIDIMIEDKVDNINKISTKIPVICFNAGYNEKCKGENIYRAYSWYDIYHILKNKIK